MMPIEDATKALRAGAPTCTVAEAKAALSRIAAGNNHAGDIRAVRVAIERLDDLSTPPADDVREVLANLPSDLNSELRLGAHWSRLICDAFEVRPRGTVTDAEVDAAGRVMYERWDEWDESDEMAAALRSLVRNALESAREARS